MSVYNCEHGIPLTQPCLDCKESGWYRNQLYGKSLELDMLRGTRCREDGATPCGNCMKCAVNDTLNPLVKQRLLDKPRFKQGDVVLVLDRILYELFSWEEGSWKVRRITNDGEHVTFHPVADIAIPESYMVLKGYVQGGRIVFTS